ncbi:MAG: PAS domain S-box protein, partial [Deltaproteobacteria bacterium]|nr:PAS domain S-box protein [Deltaproteobacteria bacterium]
MPKKSSTNGSRRQSGEGVPFRDIAEMGNDGILVCDGRDKIVFANQVAAEITECSRDELVGRKLPTLLGKQYRALLKDIQTNRRKYGRKFCTEMQIVTARGDIKEAEVCIASAKSNGKMKTFVYLRDTTERKRFEREMRESEEKYRDLFERVRHGIFISTKEGKFLDCNPALLEMLGYRSKREFLEIDIARDLYVNPEDRRTFQRLVERNGFAKDFEVEFKRKDGRKITILLTAHPIRDERGESIGYQGLNIDITERKEMERKVQEAVKKFQKISEMGEEGIIVIDEGNRIIFANSMATELIGYLNEELLGMKFTDLLNVRDKKFLAEMHDQVGLDESKRVCTEMDILTADGKTKESEVCITIARPEVGRMNTFVYLRDITERKRFERDLKASEEKYRNLFERVRHGLFISSKEGRFLDCNQALLDMLGYEDKEEFLRIDIVRDLYVNPKERRRFQKLIEKEGFVKDFEVDFKKKNGETITILLTAHAMRGPGGEVIGYEGLNIDISQRNTMERELREANEFLTNLIESSVDGIIVTDLKGNILIFNTGAERILGYQSEEVIGKMNIRELYPPGVAQEVMKKMRSPDYGEVGNLDSLRIVLRNKWGEWIDGDLSASLIYDDQGNETGSIGIFKDLRERLKMEEKLRETQQQLMHSEKLAAMGRLTSQIAHELNNPIYGIMNTLELLKTEIPPESKRSKILEMSLSETHRLSEMLRNMLTFSKPEEEVRRPMDVNELLEGIVLFIDKQMRETNIDIEKRFEGGVPKVMGSTNQLRQVLLNIIRNAKEAMPQGGILSLETVGEDTRVIIHIKDTGMGIPKEIRDKIFDAFFTTKHEVKGVGLGLSVCYGIIRDHGGDIRVESEEGKGSTFSIILP